MGKADINITPHSPRNSRPQPRTQQISPMKRIKLQQQDESSSEEEEEADAIPHRVFEKISGIQPQKLKTRGNLKTDGYIILTLDRIHLPTPKQVQGTANRMEGETIRNGNGENKSRMFVIPSEKNDGHVKRTLGYYRPLLIQAYHAIVKSGCAINLCHPDDALGTMSFIKSKPNGRIQDIHLDFGLLDVNTVMDLCKHKPKREMLEQNQSYSVIALVEGT